MLPKNKPPWLTIARRQLASLRNEKTIVFAIIVQVVVASFSSFLVVGLVSLYSPDGVESNQLVSIGVTGDATDTTAPYFEELDTVSVERYATYDDASQDFQDGRLNGIIETQYRDNGRISTTVTAAETGVQSTLVVVRSKQALKELEQNQRTQLAEETTVDTLRLSEGSQSSPYLSYTYVVLLPLLLILPAFISGSIVSDTIIEDRRNGMLELLRSAPATDRDIVRGKMAVPLALGPLQVAAWIALVELNGIPISNPGLLIAIGTGLTLTAAGIGAFTTQRTNDRGKAQFLYSTVLVFFLSLTILLPEAPITTIAKLAMNSQTLTTYILAVGYLAFGLLVYAANMWKFNLDIN